jgi:hypothetical protein
VIAFFTILKLRNNPFGLVLRAPLTIQPRAERRDDAHEILNQIFFAALRQINHIDSSVLQLQQLLNVVEAKASQAVFVFHHHQRQGRVAQQLQQLGAGIVHAGANFFHHRADLTAFGCAVILQAFGLPFQIRFVFGSRDACLDRHLTGRDDLRFFRRGVSHDDGAGVRLKAGQFPGLEPAPSHAIGNPNLPRVGTQFHIAILEQAFLIVNG